MKKIIEEESWREFIDRFGVHQRNATFAEWITSTPLKGLGEKTETVRLLLQHDPDALAAYDSALIGKPGNPTGNNQYKKKHGNSNNITNSTINDRGTSKSYSLRRLKRERPKPTKRRSWRSDWIEATFMSRLRFRAHVSHQTNLSRILERSLAPMGRSVGATPELTM